MDKGQDAEMLVSIVVEESLVLAVLLQRQGHGMHGSARAAHWSLPSGPAVPLAVAAFSSTDLEAPQSAWPPSAAALVPAVVAGEAAAVEAAKLAGPSLTCKYVSAECVRLA
jgi:hypothetical protein